MGQSSPDLGEASDMTARNRILWKVCGSALGAGTLLQSTNCNVQYPPDNTECIPYFGICFALPKEVAALDDAFAGEPTAADVAGE
jgi:hypothetical protein